MSLLSALRERTSELHAEAERTGVIRELLRGQASRWAYALLLRNLEPVYRALEAGLEQRASWPVVSVMARPELFRSQVIAGDLEAIAGTAWPAELPLLRAGERYGDHIRNVAETEPQGLAGHAYVRYLGDLSGGQILKRVLARRLGLTPSELRFYDFPEIADPDGYKNQLLEALDRAGAGGADPGRILEEAVRSFALAIDLSNEVQAAVAVGDEAQVGARGPRRRDRMSRAAPRP